MQTSFHPIIHISVSVLCIHESTNTVICAVTFKSFTHILIFPSTALLSIHPPFLLFILIPLSTNTSLRVFHPHICPDRQTDIHLPTHLPSFQFRAQAAYTGTRVWFPALTWGSQPSSFRRIWCPPLDSTINTLPVIYQTKLILLKSQGIHQSTTQVISSTVFMQGKSFSIGALMYSCELLCTHIYKFEDSNWHKEDKNILSI